MNVLSAATWRASRGKRVRAKRAIGDEGDLVVKRWSQRRLGCVLAAVVRRGRLGMYRRVWLWGSQGSANGLSVLCRQGRDEGLCMIDCARDLPVSEHARAAEGDTAACGVVMARVGGR